MDQRERPNPTTSWADVVGYEHEVVHTGVLWSLLSDADCGPGLASKLTGLGVAFVDNVEREKWPTGGGRKADLVAELVLADGSTRALAVETKVHSDGSVEQLSETFGEAPGVGVLLAVGLTGLKMSRWDTENATTPSAAWAFVDAAHWLKELEALNDAPTWVPPYMDTLRRWAAWLAAGTASEEDLADGRRRQELEHLRHLADLRWNLRNPADWGPITTLISGPLLTYWGWEYPPNEDAAYIQIMGKWNGTRAAHLKVWVSEAERLEALKQGVTAAVDQAGIPGLLPPARRGSGKTSATIAAAELPESPKAGAELTDRIIAALLPVLTPERLRLAG